MLDKSLPFIFDHLVLDSEILGSCISINLVPVVTGQANRLSRSVKIYL